MISRAAKLGFITGAVLLAVWAPSSAWIERCYSNGWYPRWDDLVRSITDRVPFALGDIVLPGFIVALIVPFFRGWRRAVDAVPLVLATIFLWFLFSWGWNYDRIPLEKKLVLHPERATDAAMLALGDRAIRMMNENVAAAHAEQLDDTELRRRLAPTFHAVTGRLGERIAFSSTPPKTSIFDAFMLASGTYGFTDPWTHEITLSSALLPFERPFAYAHEWSHLSGFADESEANFISAIACTTSSDPAIRYSGWMLVWFNLPSTIHVKRHAKRQVIADIRAVIAANRRNTQPFIERAQRRVYGSYLRANKVHAGVESYRLFVRFLTEGEYDAEGLPMVRNFITIASRAADRPAGALH